MDIPSETLAVISTSHVFPGEVSVITPGIKGHQIIGMSREEGWFLLTDQDVPLQPYLTRLLRLLRARGFDWVLLDRDAPRVEGLVAWDW